MIRVKLYDGAFNSRGRRSSTRGVKRLKMTSTRRRRWKRKTRWEKDKAVSWDKAGFLSQLNCSHGIAPWESLSSNARIWDSGLPGFHPPLRSLPGSEHFIFKIGIFFFIHYKLMDCQDIFSHCFIELEIYVAYVTRNVS